MHSTFSQKTYVDTATIYYLRPYSTGILQKNRNNKQNRVLNESCRLGLTLDILVWSEKSPSSSDAPANSGGGWWSGDVVAGQLPPTGNQLLVSGIGTRRSPVASLQRLQLPVKHKRSRQQASISRMTTAPHAQQCNRQPTHWEWSAFPPHTQAPASSFPIMWRITNWDETNLFFFFFILGVSQVVGSNLWLVVNSWVLIKARPEFTVLQIEVVH